MIVIPILVLHGSPEAAAIAAKMAARHDKMTSAAVLVSDGLTNVLATKIRFTKEGCIVAMPNQQIVEVRPQNVRFYDQIFGQVASAKPRQSLKIPDAASSVAIVHQEPLSWLVESDQRKTFFAEIRQDPRWTLKANSLVLVDAKKKIRSEVLFDTTFRVVEIRLAMNGKVITDWKYRYVTDKEIPSIPAGAKQVKGLPPRPAMPNGTKGDAVILAQKVWRSVSHLENRTIHLSNNDGQYTFLIKNGEFNETGPGGSWKLSGNALKISPKSKAEVNLKVDARKIIDTLLTHGITPSPFAWYFLNRKLPYLEMFDHCDAIQVEGVGSFDGKPLTILQIRRSTTRVRMYVDAKTGDIAMISSDARDASGNVVNASRLTITYR